MRNSTRFMLTVATCLSMVSIVEFSAIDHAYSRASSSVSSRPSPSRMFGGSVSRSSGLKNMFGGSSSGSNSVLGRTVTKNQSLGALNRSIGVSTADNQSTSSIPKTSIPTSSQSGPYQQPRTYIPPTFSYTNTSPQSAPVVVNHYHDDNTSGLVAGTLIGSMLSHHDSEHSSTPVSTTPTYVPPVQNVNQQDAYVPQHNNSHWLLWSVFGLAVVAMGAAGIMYYAMNKDSKNFTDNVVKSTVNNIKNRPNKDYCDLSSYVNPLNVKIATEGSSVASSIIGIDLDVRVLSMSATGYFPTIVGKTFVVSGYSSLSFEGPLAGIIMERVYLDDNSMFLQLIINNDKIEEITLYTVIDDSEIPEDEIEKIAHGNGRFNQKQLIMKNNKDEDVTYDRIIDPNSNTVNLIEGEENISSPNGDYDNFHKMMFFERKHDNISEYLITDIRYVKNNDGEIDDFGYNTIVGIPVNQNSIHSY